MGKRMRVKRRHGQSFSLDMLAATFLFILVVLIFILYSRGLQGSIRAADLDQEALILSSYFIENSSLSQGRLAERTFETWVGRIREDPNAYYTLKGELGVVDDFCIYLQDENGSIIRLSNGELSLLGEPKQCAVKE